MRLLICLSTSVVPDGTSFAPKPAEYDLPLLGDLRWQGVHDALAHNIADRSIFVGGNERIKPEDLPSHVYLPLEREGQTVLLPRPYAACHWLSLVKHIDPDRLAWRSSVGNTGGNIATVAALLTEHKAAEITLTTNFYHIPRVIMDLNAAGLRCVNLVPSEAFSLAVHERGSAERARIQSHLLASFGESALARRAIGEINGIADKITGSYAARAS